MVDEPDNWYSKWFDDLYLKVYSHRDTSEARDFIEKWPIFDQLPKGGRCLDLGCGTGRYSELLVARNLNVLGIDLSPSLLRVAQANLTGNAKYQPRINYVRADMRSIPVRGKFSLIVSLFTSFGYFDDIENRAVLTQASELLLQGGYLILDIPNPENVELTVRRQPNTIREINGTMIREERSYDQDRRRVDKVIYIEDADGSHSYRESVRLYSKEEIIEIFDACGLTTQFGIWGDYMGNDIDTDKPRQIFFGLKNV